MAKRTKTKFVATVVLTQDVEPDEALRMDQVRKIVQRALVDGSVGVFSKVTIRAIDLDMQDM